MNSQSNNKSGLTHYLILSAICLILGGIIHAYNSYLDNSNKELEKSYAQAYKSYKEKNIYFLPLNTINWIEIRQNEGGYFVTNPDLINEPSQYNQNSLRSTRYALATLNQLDAIGSIDESSILEFIKNRYHKFIDDNENELAGFSTLETTEVAVRPTMDAILVLQYLNATDKLDIDWSAVRRFILKHQNWDGGFWDPHYPKFKKKSCLKCSSFALRALGELNQIQNIEFSSEFKTKVTDYVKASWDSKKQSYSQLIGGIANDSYDIFRAFIILWNLETGSLEKKRSFVLEQLSIDKIQHTLNKHFKTNDDAFARKYDAAYPSMKATHLIVWMFYNLGLLEKLNKKDIVKYVFINEKNPGEYGGDIYNTYSATGILTKFNVNKEALIAPKKPELRKSIIPNFIPYLLYLFAIGVGLISFSKDKKNLIDENLLLESKVFKDKLTGLHNRDFFERAYDFHLETDEVMSLILMDIDYFKEINDQHGHLAGDLILQEFSTLMQSSLRSSDTLARWGGEEFALLCPYTDLKSAIVLADKLRKAIERHRFSHIEKLTCSFGVSTRIDSDSLDDMFERADQAIYQSKQAGRNTVSHS